MEFILKSQSGFKFLIGNIVDGEKGEYHLLVEIKDSIQVYILVWGSSLYVSYIHYALFSLFLCWIFWIRLNLLVNILTRQYQQGKVSQGTQKGLIWRSIFTKHYDTILETFLFTSKSIRNSIKDEFTVLHSSCEYFFMACFISFCFVLLLFWTWTANDHSKIDGVDNQFIKIKDQS